MEISLLIVLLILVLRTKWPYYITIPFVVFHLLLPVVYHLLSSSGLLLNKFGVPQYFVDEYYFIALGNSSEMKAGLTPPFINMMPLSVYYGAFLSIFNDLVFDIALFARITNQYAFFGTLFFTRKTLKYYNVGQRNIEWISVFLVLSPSIGYYTYLVLRESWMIFLTTYAFYSFIKKSYIQVAIALFFLSYMRLHLSLSVAFGLFFAFFNAPVLITFISSLCAFYFALELKIVPFYTTQEMFLSYMPRYVVDITGLNFLIDTSFFNISEASIYIRRFIVSDIVTIPLVCFILIMFVSLRVKPIVSFFLCSSYIYAFMYNITSFTSARQIIIPFYAIFLIMLSTILAEERNIKKVYSPFERG